MLIIKEFTTYTWPYFSGYDYVSYLCAHQNSNMSVLYSVLTSLWWSSILQVLSAEMYKKNVFGHELFVQLREFNLG